MNTRSSLFTLQALLTVALCFSVGPLKAQVAAPPSPEVRPPTIPLDSTSPSVERETLVLSPFQVVSNSNGYYNGNTMSGTRLNTRLEDLASAISVVTKEQMQDLGLLDVNDIFNYEANTEGTGNYTDFTFNSSGMPMDNVQSNPQGANRIRGLNTANTTIGNFETSGRVPLDPINVDSVEISRGPNSSIFGIGSPAGTVNSVPSSANLRKNKAEVVFRADNRDGWRTSLDLNRVLKHDVLAVRASFVKQHDGFALKPSGFATERLNGMLKYRPFRRTTLTGSYQHYHAEGNRPNSLAPRDGISGWLNAGSPTWDPVTSTAKINGVAVGTFPGTTNPAYFTTQIGTILGYIDQTGLSHLGQARGSAGNTPLTQTQNIRLVTPAVDPSGYLASQPLFQKYPVLADRTIYDWSSINVAAMNRFEDETDILSLLLDQSLLRTHRQALDVQFGWFRESSDRYTRNLLGSLSPSQGFASTVTIDVNERMLDGTPNPYFLRPFIQLDRPYTYKQPIDRDTYRAQLAYSLDLRQETSPWRWLGMHQLSAYAEYKNIVARQYMYRDALVSNHAWSDTTTNRAGGATTQYVIYPRFYIGDNSGNNIDYGPTAFAPGAYSLRWGNAVTQNFVTEPVQIDTAIANELGNGTGGSNNSWTILKSQGAILQSFLLKDRLVTTFGLREDQRYSRTGVTPLFLDPITLDQASFDSWDTRDWAIGKGRTTTSGAVLKVLPWLNITANKSNSFQPAAVGYNLYREVLPDPTGEGEDYGISLNLFSNKLIVRLNRYRTVQINSRNGDSANIAQRVRRLDYSSVTGSAYTLQRQATAWLTEAAQANGITLTQDQLNQQLADTMQLPVSFISDPPPNGTAVDDVTARGTELELNYNPSPFWTMKLNVTQQESINSSLAGEVGQWIADRMPVWKSIIDPRNNLPWFTQNYSGGSAESYFITNVQTPLKIAQALQNKSRPQVRQYRANFVTNFRLAGISENRLLKRFSVGGAVRWEDKGAIGFWGKQQIPATITELDADRPIWDKSRTYFDAFVTYKTQILSDKVGLKLQLNARNIFESGHLQPVAAEADGRISAYRIIDPRLFILTATFSM